MRHLLKEMVDFVGGRRKEIIKTKQVENLQELSNASYQQLGRGQIAIKM